MLKIGTVKWQAKCSRHPAFNPSADGPEAIKGGCPRCQELIDIYESHRRTMRLMREFSPAGERRGKPRVDSLREMQQTLFPVS